MHPNVEASIKREYAAQKSEKWLALRGNMLTASDAATAIGVNKYETPDGLLLKIIRVGTTWARCCSELKTLTSMATSPSQRWMYFMNTKK